MTTVKTDLGYSKYANFENVIGKAIVACSRAGEEPTDHFADVGKLIDIGKGGQRGWRCLRSRRRWRRQFFDGRPIPWLRRRRRRNSRRDRHHLRAIVSFNALNPIHRVKP